MTQCFVQVTPQNPVLRYEHPSFLKQSFVLPPLTVNCPSNLINNKDTFDFNHLNTSNGALHNVANNNDNEIYKIQQPSNNNDLNHSNNSFKVKSIVCQNILKNDLKERNRIAAKKWRKKKENYLSNLEIENDFLRQSALSLFKEMKTLKIENDVFNREMQYFQAFFSSLFK